MEYNKVYRPGVFYVRQALVAEEVHDTEVWAGVSRIR